MISPTASVACEGKQLLRQYEAVCARGLKLDMSRGKPSPRQLNLCDELLTILSPEIVAAEPGSDPRNYGGLQGLERLRALFTEVLQVPPSQIVAAGNSSLSLMHDCLTYALLKGFPGHRPWSLESKITFLCPVPGYDRHFALAEQYGILLEPVAMTGRGPAMDDVERMVADPSVKGMWCVPTYSNPTGETYDAETVQRLAQMATGAADFRLFWDQAYASHHLTDQVHRVPNILEFCGEAGHPDRPLLFTSSSKITYAGAGVAFFGSSKENIRWYLSCAAFRSIGPDKINQLRHALLLERLGLARLMRAHREFLAPKFSVVFDILERNLAGKNVACWTVPEGGYFFSFDMLKGSAKRVVELAEEMGLLLTPAGATFPYGVDPADRNIRIAPTFPSLAELREASEVISLSAQIAAWEARNGHKISVEPKGLP